MVEGILFGGIAVITIINFLIACDNAASINKLRASHQKVGEGLKQPIIDVLEFTSKALEQNAELKQEVENIKDRLSYN